MMDDEMNKFGGGGMGMGPGFTGMVMYMEGKMQMEEGGGRSGQVTCGCLSCCRENDLFALSQVRPTRSASIHSFFSG